MVFARIGHGSCYYHWNEIFAGVTCDTGEHTHIEEIKWFLTKPCLGSVVAKLYLIFNDLASLDNILYFVVWL